MKSERKYPSNGDAIRRELLGDEYVESASKSTYSGRTMGTFIEVANRLIFDGLWTRPGLDLKTRTLVCVVSDVATGNTGVLPAHLHMALRQGWSESELTEVLLQLIGYVGAPLVREAMLCAQEVFDEARHSAKTS